MLRKAASGWNSERTDMRQRPVSPMAGRGRARAVLASNRPQPLDDDDDDDYDDFLSIKLAHK